MPAGLKKKELRTELDLTPKQKMLWKYMLQIGDQLLKLKH